MPHHPDDFGLLDDANRVDQGPQPGGPWEPSPAVIWAGQEGLRVEGNQIRKSGGSYRDAYMTESHSRPCACGSTITAADLGQMFWHLMETPGPTGYEGLVEGTSIQIRRRSSGTVQASATATLPAAVAAGDQARLIADDDGHVYMWFKAVGGSWVQHVDLIDNVLSGPFHPGFESNSAAGRWDDFIGGAAVTGAEFIDSGTGTLVISGTGSDAAEHDGAGTGTLAITGTGVDEFSQGTEFIDSSTGTIAFAGTGADAAEHDSSGEGTLALTGTSADAIEVSDAGVGTLAITGAGVDQFTVGGATVFVDTGTGTLAITGSGTEQFTAMISTPPRGYQAVIIDRAGNARQTIQPRQLKIMPQLNGHVVVTCVVDLREGDASELMVGSRGLRLHREGTLVFQGSIVSPLRFHASPSLSNVTVTAWSPLGVLNRRFIHTNEEIFASFVDQPVEDIVTTLLSLANGQEETHLRMADSLDVSVNRDRDYEVGKNIGEAINQLAYVQNGFFYRDRPVLEGAVWSRLDIMYPDAGIDKPGALFSFGTGTRGSVNEFIVEYELPTNDVIALGAIDSETQEPIVSEAVDATSQSEFGGWGSVISYSDVIIQSTLDDHATESIDAEPPVIYNVKPLPTSTDESGSAPRWLVDFDVGDTVRLTLRANAPYDVSGAEARVNSCTIAVSDDALVETLEEITFEVLPPPISS